MQYVNVIVSA